MNKLLVLAVMLFAFGANVFAQTEMMKSGASYILDESGNLIETTKPILNFEKETHDFGDLPEGPQASYSFKFKNDGKEDLLISDVKHLAVVQHPLGLAKPLNRVKKLLSLLLTAQANA